MQEIQNIVLLGAGNVATRMGLALHQAGFTIRQVWSRTLSAATTLADELKASPVNGLSSILPDADLYILSVPDDAIPGILGKMDAAGKFIVHTSGSVSMDVLASFTDNYGVIYPVQTFSKVREVDFSNIPVCIEANSLKNLELLNRLVSRISVDIRAIPSEQRRMLHLAAVFACNFPNFMYLVAESITRAAKLDFDLLKPLILETAEKVQVLSPAEAQTGPALRGDLQVMGRHLELLGSNPETRELYETLSKAIGKMKNEPIK